jgi:hypothetical protein
VNGTPTLADADDELVITGITEWVLPCTVEVEVVVLLNMELIMEVSDGGATVAGIDGTDMLM